MQEMIPGRTYTGTGHRPPKLGVYPATASAGAYSEEIRESLVLYLMEILPFYHAAKLILGMALGFDQAMAVAACRLGIPWIAAVPFNGQEKYWPEPSRIFYRELLSKALEVVIVSEGDYSLAKMQIRNEWQVDHSDAVIALWNGSKGGTANCLVYAGTMKKEVFNIWPGWEAWSYLTAK